MELREQMENTGAIFHTSIDSEIIAYGIARERVHSKTVEEAILRTVKEIRGAYALVIMSPRKLIGVRDPYGLKPLCIGKAGQRLGSRLGKLRPHFDRRRIRPRCRSGRNCNV